MEYGLYLHIPYCRSRCSYCDFYTAACNGGVPDEYVDALLRDFYRYAPKENGTEPLRPSTVYFGGGTPGLLNPLQVARVLEAVNPLPHAEITLETNPGLADEGYFAALHRSGVNRLSLGVQTARDESLVRLGRRHTAEDARRALAYAGTAGFDNITGDIMLALPEYSEEEFDETLALLQQGGATHISAYLLKLEPGTPMAAAPLANLPDADRAADFYLYAVERLEVAGYHQYEISNFAKPGHEGRHNLMYWGCHNTLGLGPAAHSLIDGRRFSFGRDTAAYIKARLAVTEEGMLEVQEYIMLQLRLTAGLQEAELQGRFGVSLDERQKNLLCRFEKAGYVNRREGGWSLTPAGMLVQNALLAELL